jgi:dTDP-4-dehydrorhamnose 3,5-epimerase
LLFSPTAIDGVWTVDLDRKTDERGFFARAICQREYAEHGIAADIRQANISMGFRAGTFRGLHAQCPPAIETKIIRCISGALLDVLVDLRPESATFGQCLSVGLTAESGRSLVVPDRCAHGFLTLEADTRAMYTVSEFNVPGEEVGLNWDDPVVTVEWPITPTVVSDKDRSWPTFAAQRATLVRRMTL